MQSFDVIAQTLKEILYTKKIILSELKLLNLGGTFNFGQLENLFNFPFYDLISNYTTTTQVFLNDFILKV